MGKHVLKTRTWLSLIAVGAATVLFQNCGPAFVAGDLTGEVNLSSVTLAKSCGSPQSSARAVPLRSLSNDEYRNIVRDVLFVSPDLSSLLPTNSLGNSGFRNDAEALGTLDLDHLDRFYKSAEKIAANVIGGQNNVTSAYHRILFCSRQAVPAGSVQITKNLMMDPRTFAAKVADTGTDELGGVYGSQGYEIYRNGYVGQDIFIRRSGAYQLRVRAGQRPGKSGSAHMVVVVNGTTVGEFNVGGDRMIADYDLNLNFAAGPQELRVLFDNDDYVVEGDITYDRNLILESVHWRSVPAGTETLVTGDACLKSAYQELASRLFRRGLGDAEVRDQAERLTAMTTAATSTARGLGDAVVTLLMDPRFLLVKHASVGGRLTNEGMASKLALLLWQSAPDDELRAEAEAGRLMETEKLNAQIRRMLKDPRAKSLAAVLRKEWLGLAAFESGTFDGLSSTLQAAYIKETTMFLEDLIQADRPLSWLLSSDQTYVNKELADLYGLPFPAGVAPASFVRVPTTGTVRQGVIAQAAVLAATAGGTSATHPVRRGLWVADRILCAKPPPPPPGIPALPNDPSTEGSIRQRLEAHTKSSACLGCHQKMDVYGLGMENFDPFGRWRDRYHDNSNVESWGTDRAAGLEFANSRQLIERLPAVEQAQSCVAESLIRLGQNRAATAHEKCASSVIGAVAFKNGMSFSDYVSALVSSESFWVQPE